LDEIARQLRFIVRDEPPVATAIRVSNGDVRIALGMRLLTPELAEKLAPFSPLDVSPEIVPVR
jgi:hypothetical protein